MVFKFWSKASQLDQNFVDFWTLPLYHHVININKEDRLLVNNLVDFVNTVHFDFYSANRINEHVRIDSIVLHDSIFIREKSDTVFFTKYRTLYRERLLRDTVVQCDTIYVEREVSIEKKDHFPYLLLFVAIILFLLWRSGVLGVLRKLFFKI